MTEGFGTSFPLVKRNLFTRKEEILKTNQKEVHRFLNLDRVTSLGVSFRYVLGEEFIFLLAKKAGSLCCEGLTLHSGCRGKDQQLGIPRILPDQGKKVNADALPLALRLWLWVRAGAGGTGHNTCLCMGICQGASVLYVTLPRPFDKPLRSCSGFDLRRDVLLTGVLAG